MSKELRDILAKYGVGFSMADKQGTPEEVFEQLIDELDRYAAERERKSYLKGYNTGWQSGKRFNPNKISYFAEQLEYTAKKLREVESALKETTK